MKLSNPLRKWWRAARSKQNAKARLTPTTTAEWIQLAASSSFEIAPDDPIVSHFLKNPDVTEIDRLNLHSPAIQALREAGAEVAIPLVSNGELVGILNLGPRMSQQEYSADDRRLLNMLSSQVAPALRVAQLVHQQQAEALEHERLEQELRVARLIQQTLLPKQLPSLPGWQMAGHYEPAEAVGGDFYDFIYFEDGRLGMVIGDVTDKGMPAALVMATTRSLLRSVAQQLVSPGAVLERVNDLLDPDIPPNMFVTCLYAVLDPITGRLRYANAGHNLPVRHSNGEVTELWATGMPLGLMPNMRYDEAETVIEPGEFFLFYSDGLVEAHNGSREMFGSLRLHSLMSDHCNSGPDLIKYLLGELASFTGPGSEQEDDVTLVTLHRMAAH